MKKILSILAIATALSSCLVGVSSAHSGRTNASGCHNDNVNGGYHCHNGGSSSSSSSSSTSSTTQGSSVCPYGGQRHGYNGWAGSYSNVNVRTGPSTSSDVVTTLMEVGLVQIHSWRQESDGKWAWLTTAEGQDGWAKYPYVDCMELEWLDIMATLENGNSQSRITLLESIGGRNIGYGLNGDRVEVISSIGEWYEVWFPVSGAIGWIHDDQVRVD